MIIYGERIETTPEHPFYVEGNGWTPAGSLQVGDQIRQADGTTDIVWQKRNVYQTKEMYNFTVSTVQTYFDMWATAITNGLELNISTKNLCSTAEVEDFHGVCE